MITDQRLQFKPDGTIILTNHVDPSALLDKIKAKRQEVAKLGGSAAKGFSADKFKRHVGAVSTTLLLTQPLLKYGWQAELAGDQDTADRAYKLFFNMFPEYRTSLGSI